MLQRVGRVYYENKTDSVVVVYTGGGRTENQEKWDVRPSKEMANCADRDDEEESCYHIGLCCTNWICSVLVLQETLYYYYSWCCEFGEKCLLYKMVHQET
jgi:hypothetical protein